MHDQPAYALWLKLAIGLGAVSITTLMAAGIGLLQMKPWGRTLSIVYAIYGIIMAIMNAWMGFIFLSPPAGAHPHGLPAAGAVVSGFMGMIYPAMLLYFMLRPKIAAALGRE